MQKPVHSTHCVRCCRCTHHVPQRKWAETSGVHGMERDVVNVVPDFLTHWLGVPEVLAGLTGHWSTGERLDMDKVRNPNLAPISMKLPGIRSFHLAHLDHI